MFMPAILFRFLCQESVASFAAPFAVPGVLSVYSFVCFVTFTTAIAQDHFFSPNTESISNKHRFISKAAFISPLRLEISSRLFNISLSCLTAPFSLRSFKSYPSCAPCLYENCACVIGVLTSVETCLYCCVLNLFHNSDIVSCLSVIVLSSLGVWCGARTS